MSVGVRKVGLSKGSKANEAKYNAPSEPEKKSFFKKKVVKKKAKK